MKRRDEMKWQAHPSDAPAILRMSVVDQSSRVV